MENARECYHCATSHPELSLTFPIGVSGNFDYGEEARRHADYNARMAAAGPAGRAARGRLVAGDPLPAQRGLPVDDHGRPDRACAS